MRCITRNLQSALSLIVVAALSGCDMLGFHEWQWRQKLTVSVMTPEGMKTGSSVVSVNVYATPSWWGLGDFKGAGGGSLSGESVTVDLGNGRYLFALLKDYSYETARETFIPNGEQPRTKAEATAAYDRLERMRGSRDLQREYYPLLVTFDDIHNPTSLRRVDPGDLTASFGPDYRLNAITLSITDEPVTEGRVETVLEWLAAIGRERPTLIPNTPLLRENATDPDIQYLTPGAFSTELYK
ncbi:hypothetical protein DFR48_10882 [Ciceribacter lividus]|uniref:Uncharacterized protein n=2 Tax=Ciceribacter lividus TaxID=1197950 RepID=A0A6I7HJ73_9HYPH|nr:hypothetical protein DFR48_10882 [Ciceribacter lividus]